MSAHPSPSRVSGVGLGLRWDFLDEVALGPELPVDFFEVSPENYLRRAGWVSDRLAQVVERYPISSHGLSLSVGSTRELDRELVAALSGFLDATRAPWHSDHLCLASLPGRHLHDLLPMVRNRAGRQRVVERAQWLAEELGRPFVLENITYYSELGRAELSEAEFIGEVIEASGAGLLLDVNNIYVNSRNHGFSAEEFLDSLPLDRVVEIHVAGFSERVDGTLIDTHGADVADPVFALLERALRQTGPVPVLLERDNEVPPLAELLEELGRLRAVVGAALEPARAA